MSACATPIISVPTVLLHKLCFSCFFAKSKWIHSLKLSLLSAQPRPRERHAISIWRSKNSSTLKKPLNKAKEFWLSRVNTRSIRVLHLHISRQGYVATWVQVKITLELKWERLQTFPAIKQKNITTFLDGKRHWNTDLWQHVLYLRPPVGGVSLESETPPNSNCSLSKF